MTKPKVDKLELVREAVRHACEKMGFDVDKLTVLRADGTPPPASFTLVGHMPSTYYGSFHIWRPKSQGESPEGYKVHSVQFDRDTLESSAWQAAVHVSAYVQEHGYEWERPWWEEAI